MSKKKSFSGSTMTLKDFHGGSIPSDLPLPSAPGLSVRPADRWAPSGIGPRPGSDIHHRPRPGSAGSGSGPSTRIGSGFVTEERGPPFLSTPANIGRHFEEDERKPFDASAAFPRRAAAPTISDPVPIVRSDPKPNPRPANNAWGLRKEPAAAANTHEFVQPTVNLSSRFAQASAVEKVTSGRWQTRVGGMAEVVVERFGEMVRVGEEGLRPVSGEGRVGGGGSGVHLGVDGIERPKLRLLPRTRPVDENEVRGVVVEEKQVYQPPVDLVHIESPRETQGNINMPRPGSAGADVGGRLTERPRLNLKPRSLPVEKSDEIGERERKSVFGGARPREFVLKERGVDDVVDVEVTSPANRVRSDIPRTDGKQKLESPTFPTRRGERPEILPAEQRSGPDFERKDTRSESEKADHQRASWRSDKKKNSKEIEKPVERRPEPDTWRKLVEPPQTDVPGPTGPRLGKAASSLELAQAFSRSVSSDSSRSGTGGLPGRVQVPFSRLTDTRDFYAGPNPRKINGY